MNLLFAITELFLSLVIYRIIFGKFDLLAVGGGIFTSIVVFFGIRDCSVIKSFAFFFIIWNLYILSLKDIKYRYITLNNILFFAIGIVIYRFFIYIPLELNIISVFIAFIILFIPYVLSRKKGLGIGDIIIFSLLAIILTPVEVVVVFLIMSISALFFSILYTLISKNRELIPLLPFMSFSFYIYIMANMKLLNILGMLPAYYFQFVNKF